MHLAEASTWLLVTLSMYCGSGASVKSLLVVKGVVSAIALSSLLLTHASVDARLASISCWVAPANLQNM